MNNLNQAISDYEHLFIGICELSKKYKIPNKEIRKALEDKGYYLGKGVSPKSVVHIKLAVEEYKNILNAGEEPNIHQLALKYDISDTSIKDNLIRLNLPVVRYPKKIHFDEHVFDVIDTEEKAYWLGFLTADGYICSRDNTFGIGLASIDKHHVEKYATFLKCPQHVKFKNNEHAGIYRCDLGNAHVKQVLQKYGFTASKSFDCTFLKDQFFANSDLIRHYIRGYFDGDGCVSYKKKYRKTINATIYIPIVSIVGTEAFLQELRNKSSLICLFQSQQNLWNLYGSGKKAKDFLYYIYNNATIYLDRKYNIYKNYIAPHLEKSSVPQWPISVDTEM
jgi:hypothetical protein